MPTLLLLPALAAVLLALARPVKFGAGSLQLGALLGEGTFGSVYSARVDGEPAVAKCALKGVALAAEYLTTEQVINSGLVQRLPGSPHLAPYLGTVDVADGERFLLWGACGTTTLRSLLAAGPTGLRTLAVALGVDPSDRAELMREVLRQLLECVAAVAECNVVHRDVKPENLLVDGTSRTLRLIDFGSACEKRGYFFQTGYRADRGPCSLLYAPPEQLLDCNAPFAYDVFSAAVVWLRCAMPALQGTDDAPLENFRAELTAADGLVERWLARKLAGQEAAAWLQGLEFFDGGVEGRLAWRLLRAMLEPDARNRPSAREALAGPYLGPSCTGEDFVAEDACYVDDLEEPPSEPGSANMKEAGYRVELRLPLGLVLEEADAGARARRERLLLPRTKKEKAQQRSRAAAAAAELPGEKVHSDHTRIQHNFQDS